MLEVPSLIWQLDVLLKDIDFISIGTNDLMQYLFAADRGNRTTKNRYDVLSPAMLSALKTIHDKCKNVDIPVTVCGEMAGQPLDAMVLLALGFRSLSVSPQSVGCIKMMIESLDICKVEAYISSLLTSQEHSFRNRLRAFAYDHNIVV